MDDGLKSALDLSFGAGIAAARGSCCIVGPEAFLASLKSFGFAIVPREATQRMVMASLESSVAIMNENGVDSLSPTDAWPSPSDVSKAAYRAMIAAFEGE